MLLTRDAALGEHLSRLAAAAGAAPAQTTEPAVALRSWSAAPLVLVGGDLAPEMAALAPPRRAGVHLVAWSPVEDHAFRDALGLGAEDLLEVPRHDVRVTELLGDLGEGGRARGLLVGVAGGVGGAGASTLAAALGQVAASTGASSLVVDLDPLGSGLDRLLGLQERPGVRWEDLGRTAGRLGGRALRDAVPRRQGLGVLTWCTGPADPLSAEVVRSVIGAAPRGHATVVVDLPRGGGAAAEEVLGRLDRLLVVVRPGPGAAAATSRWCARAGTWLPAGLVPMLVVRGPASDAGPLERATGLPVLLSMGAQRGLDEDVDLGLGPVRRRRGALARAAGEALALLAVRGPVGPVAA